MSNTLMKVVQRVPAGRDAEYVYKVLYDVLSELDKIYSVIIYYIHDKNEYHVQYNLSQNDNYNTVDIKDVIDKAVETILSGTTKKVAGYIQPPIEICLEVFNPLVIRLAKNQKARWKYLEEEDYAQICRMVMIRLHQKGYYLHRRLIEKSFNNELLMMFRTQRNAPPLVSFEDTFYKPVSGSSEELRFADVVEDVSIKEAEEEKYREEAEHAIFEEVKAIIIELIGERQWNELMRDYGNKHTTARTRKKMTEIKRYFEKLGLTRKEFNRKYYE